VGATFQAYSDKKTAESAASTAINNKKATSASSNSSADAIEIPIALKADVLGSLEALEREVRKLENKQVRLKIISTTVGKITDNDVKLAAGTTGTIILGFNIAAERSASDIAAKLGVEIATFDIIYKLSEWLAEQVKTRLPKVEELKVFGTAKLLKIFGNEKDKQVVGGVVTAGRFVVGKQVKILRRENEVGRGKVLELQEQKLPTKEVEADHQFGTLIESRLPLAAGDILEVFEIVEK
jgi:translation initiation factor IF-2